MNIATLLSGDIWHVYSILYHYQIMRSNYVRKKKTIDILMNNLQEQQREIYM